MWATWWLSWPALIQSDSAVAIPRFALQLTQSLYHTPWGLFSSQHLKLVLAIPSHSLRQVLEL